MIFKNAITDPYCWLCGDCWDSKYNSLLLLYYLWKSSSVGICVFSSCLLALFTSQASVNMLPDMAKGLCR